MMNDVKKERTMKDSEIIRRTLTYIRPHKKKFILAIIFMLFVIALELMVPYLSGLIIGKLSHPENTKYLTILALSIGYLGSILTSLFFMYFETMILKKQDNPSYIN